MSKVADYIFHGGTEADRQAAELDYALGCLGREIELNAALREQVRALTAVLDAARAIVELHPPRDFPYVRRLAEALEAVPA